MSPFVIEPRFCGPEGFGNGGYVCGIVGRLSSGPVEVTLRNPAPVGKTFTIERHEEGHRLLRGERIVAESRATTAALDAPPSPSLEAARSAETRFEPATHHNHKCFVCGHRREPGDGLRICAGPLNGAGDVAATWIPDRGLVGADGHIDPIYVWSALDCPSAYAIGGPVMIMLGRMVTQLLAPVPAGEPVVVTGSRRGDEGRKRYAASAVYSAEGRLLAASQSTWITIPQEQWEQMSGRRRG